MHINIYIITQAFGYLRTNHQLANISLAHPYPPDEPNAARRRGGVSEGKGKLIVRASSLMCELCLNLLEYL